MQALKNVTTSIKSLPQNTWLILYLVVGLCWLIPQGGLEGDVACFVTWSNHMRINGLAHIYNTSCNYLPGYLYVLYVFGKLQPSEGDIWQHIHLLKGLTLLVDIAAVVALVLYAKQQDKLKFWLAFSVFNIAYIYNGFFWGQIDILHSAAGLLAILLAYHNRFFWSGFVMVTAIAIKLQAVVFLPVWGVVLFPFVNKQLDLKGLGKLLLGMMVAIVFFVFPFWYRNTLDGLWNVILNSVGHYPAISMNAFNVWDLLLSGNLIERQDTEVWAGLTLKHWGLLLFGLHAAIAALALWIARYGWRGKQFTAQNFHQRNVLLLATGLIALSFFFFNTQMHERYSHPVFLSVIAYAIFTKRFLPVLFFSVAYFLNLEAVLRYLELNNYGTLIFERKFIALLFVGLLLQLYYWLYQETVAATSKRLEQA